MARGELTRHLFTFFPSLEGRDLTVPGCTVAEPVREVEKIAPGFAFYVGDESGRLRQNVNASWTAARSRTMAPSPTRSPTARAS